MTATATATREQYAASAAAELLLFADGIADAGLHQLARRSRIVAGELQWALDQLHAERSARQALQERIQTLERILLARKVDYDE